MTELFLYQTIHLRKGRPRLLAEHIHALCETSRKLFGKPYTPDAKQLEARIAALATNEGYPDTLSGSVRLELLSDGTERLTPAGVSLYDGYALRSVMPDAVVLEYALPQNDALTSAHEAATLLARQIARTTEATAAVRCDSEGILYSIDGAPLFAVRGKEVFTMTIEPEGSESGPQTSPSTLPSVERDLGIRAVLAAGLKLTGEPAIRSELPRYDEVFSVDHRGVTALAHCEGNPYMSLTAERIAKAMEDLFTHRKQH